MPMFNKRLRNILVKQGLLDDDKAQSAASAAEREKKTLSSVLIETGLVEEKDLIGAIGREMNIPPIDLSKVEAAQDALDALPQDMAAYYEVIPVAKVGDILTLAVSNPFDILKIDAIQLITNCEIRPVVSSDMSIKRAIPKFYSPGEQEISALLERTGDLDMDLREEDVENDLALDMSELTGVGQGSPVVKYVNLIVYQAVKNGISDIHIEPFEKYIRVRYRQDGLLYETTSPPKSMQNAIISRIKIVSNLDIAEKRRPQDGKFQLRIDGRQIDFRVSILPTVHGEKAVLRILDSTGLAVSLDQLGFEEQALNDFRSAIKSPWGMVLVTGPTGSGKSTTLYSAIKEIMKIEDNIVTVEDPVEYQLDGVNQVQVNVKRGLTFAGVLRSILRQDPDIVLVGEIRDSETADIAIKAALTGHLVLSTLHTNDAPSTIVRLVDMGVDTFLVASSVLLASAQRLVRRLCDDCKEAYTPSSAKDKKRLLEVGFKEEELKDLTLYRAKGCPRCAEGYRGRFALLETLPVPDEIKRLIIEGAGGMDIKKHALERGMVTLRRCGLLNTIRGHTSVEEVLRVTVHD